MSRHHCYELTTSRALGELKRPQTVWTGIVGAIVTLGVIAIVACGIYLLGG